MKNRLIIVMGVSGCGKSTIGLGIAEKLDVKFYDGDDFHPQSNIDKMVSGEALNDDDRQPWLEAINEFAREIVQKESLVVACSALKVVYREILAQKIDLVFVYLKGSAELIAKRLSARRDHFMPPGLLDSQFATLEEPANAIIVDIAKSPDEIIAQAIEELV